MNYFSTLFPSLTLLLCLAAAHAGAADWVVYEGKSGPGRGKHIVFLAGDEEYRSEEGLPQLAKILAVRHGFKCTVVFPINPPGWSAREIQEFKRANKSAPEPKPEDPDPNDGSIDPNEPTHLPGLEQLGTADLVVMLWRFRRPADPGMKYFVDAYERGVPVIGLRTSTHAFAGLSGRYKQFNQFGKQVLGEQWVSHWGNHKREATRGVIEPAAKNDPILRGVTDVFGDSDVYEAYPPADATILMRGQVLQGMKPEDPPADYKKKRATDKQEQGVNDPMMPVVWSRQHKNEAGKENKILCTTLGAATDLQSDGLRRIIVNGVYWGLGLAVPPKADVTYVGEFKPTMYGFNGFKKGIKPADHELK